MDIRTIYKTLFVLTSLLSILSEVNLQLIGTDEGLLLTEPTRCETIATGDIQCSKVGFADMKNIRKNLLPCHSDKELDDMEGNWITLPPLTDHKRNTFDIKSFLNNEKVSPIYGVDLANSTWAMSLYRRIWIPSKCRYHRFTKSSLAHYLQLRANDGLIKKTMNIAFFGDSVLRGIYCGLNRIVSGDEIFGPNIDEVCGGKLYHGKRVYRATPVTFDSEGITMPGISYAGLLNTTFTYIRFMHNQKNRINANITRPGTLDTIRDVLSRASANHTKLDAIIISSGAWSFYHAHLTYENSIQSCNRPYTNAISTCYNGAYEKVSYSRADSDSLEFITELSNLCKEHKVRLIYKNNHYNCRFGALCADQKLEDLLKFNGSQWEVWDTKQVSVQHWRDQTWDGFHFDRQSAHSLEDHYRLHWGKSFKFHGRQIPFAHSGELEMQLTQSLLNRIVFPELQYK